MSLSPRDAGAMIALLARAVPDLSPRSPALVRNASWTAGPGPAALSGRPDRIDASHAHARAVEVWERLRTWIRDGHAEDVAVLWTAHGALQVIVDEADRPMLGPEHRARQQRAVALGSAPPHLRRAWRTAAAERRRVAAYVAEQEVVTQWGREATETEPALPTLTRTLVHRHIEQSGADGPSVEASAERWGAEHLALVWSPAPVPPALARALALGFAPPETRTRWQSIRSSVLRDSESRAWGEARLSRAEDRWRS